MPFSPFSSSLPQFSGISGNFFAGPRTANTVQSFIAIKGNCCGLFVF